MDLVAHVLSALFVLCDLGVQLIDRLLLLVMWFSKVRQQSDVVSRLIQYMQNDVEGLPRQDTFSNIF